MPGKRARSWGYWSEAKLDILDRYLRAFTTAASKKSPERVYLDAFAGGPRNLSETTGAEIAGSARLALEVEPPFTRLRYFELPAQAGELRAELRQDFPDRDLEVIAGDCNVTIPRVLGQLAPYRWAPTFAFVDPDGMEVSWDTLTALADHRREEKTKVEMWLLFPSAGLCRTLALARPPSRADRRRATRLFGTQQWEVIYTLRHREEIDGGAARDEYVNLMRWRLEEVLGYHWTHQWEVRTVHGPLYHMVFATDHEAGHRIMTYLYNEAARAQPAMLEDARERQRERRTGATRLFPLPLDPGTGMTTNVYHHEPPWEPPGTA